MQNLIFICCFLLNVLLFSDDGFWDFIVKKISTTWFSITRRSCELASFVTSLLMKPIQNMISKEQLSVALKWLPPYYMLSTLCGIKIHLLFRVRSKTWQNKAILQWKKVMSLLNPWQEEMVHDFKVIIRKSLNKIFTRQYACVIGKFVGLIGRWTSHSSSTKLREKAQRSKAFPQSNIQKDFDLNRRNRRWGGFKYKTK